MKLRELTKEQQDFAAEHHNLVYAFLRNKRLLEDDYYDVIIFGYLQAVQKYLLREELRRQYAFTTIAWRAMERDLINHYKAQSRPMRKAVTISLESMTYEDERLTLAEVVPGPDYRMEQLEAKFLWDEISNMLTKPQAEALRMRADGYSVREIASARRSPLREIEDMLSSALETVHVLCPA